MFEVLSLPLLLAAVLAVGGYALWSHHRKRTSRSRWPDGSSERSAWRAEDTAGGAFPPTQVMSYNEALQSGWFETSSAVASTRKELPRLRLKLRSASEAAETRFATVTVVLIAEEGARRQLYVREEGRQELQRIAEGRVEAALDLGARARIEDLWAWLAERVPFRSFGQQGEPVDGSVVHRNGDVDTAIHTA